VSNSPAPTPPCLRPWTRHRSKRRPQVVFVERLTVESGGRVVVGAVIQEGGAHDETEDRPHAPISIAHAPGLALRSPDPRRQPVPLAAVKERERCRMHGRARGSGAQPGNRNALRNGRDSRELIEFRRAVRELLRESAEKPQLV
jgi:hypothetical protein